MPNPPFRIEIRLTLPDLKTDLIEPSKVSCPKCSQINFFDCIASGFELFIACANCGHISKIYICISYAPISDHFFI